MSDSGKIGNVFAVLLVTGLFLSCQERNPDVNANVSMSDDNNISVFWDRSDPITKYVFFLKGTSCVVQVYRAPGYMSAGLYSVDGIGSRLSKDAKVYSRMGGQIRPPLPPGGNHYGRRNVDVGATNESECVYFNNDNLAIREFLLRLRSVTVNETNYIETLPVWLSGNPRLGRYLGTGVGVKSDHKGK